MSNFIKAIIAVAFVLFGCAVAEDNATYECGHATVLVSSGDTIFSIVEKVCNGNIRNAADDTVQLNGGSVIRPGEWIQLP